jgi:hypothetical protein
MLFQIHVIRVNPRQIVAFRDQGETIQWLK